MASRVPVLFAMFLFLTCGAGFAQTSFDQRMTAHIPFDFFAGDKEMPAGNYQINFDDSNNRILIRDSAGAHAMFLNGIPEDQRHHDDTKLVFLHSGDEYFLKDMQSDFGETSFRVKRSQSSTARNNQPTQVEVAMVR